MLKLLFFILLACTASFTTDLTAGSLGVWDVASRKLKQSLKRCKHYGLATTQSKHRNNKRLLLLCALEDNEFKKYSDKHGTVPPAEKRRKIRQRILNNRVSSKLNKFTFEEPEQD